MSETNDFCCIYITVSNNKRCTKSSTKHHPIFDSLSVEGDKVFCSTHYKYTMDHPEINLEDYLFDCPKKIKLIKLIESRKPIYDLLLRATTDFKELTKTENESYELLMKKINAIISIEKTKTEVCENRDGITNANLKFKIDRMVNRNETNLVTYTPLIDRRNVSVINNFAVSPVSRIYPGKASRHIGGFLEIYPESFVDINVQMEKEFFFYKKIRERLMRDYQLKLEDLRAKFNKIKQIDPPRNVFDFFAKKQGTEIGHRTNNDRNVRTCIIGLTGTTPRGIDFFAKREKSKTRIIEEKVSVGGKIVTDLKVQDLDAHFGYRKEILSKVLSYRNIAKRIFDYLDIGFVYKLHNKINNRKIIAPIHNYFRLEPTRIFPYHENYTICDVLIYPKHTGGGAFRYGFGIDVICVGKNGDRIKIAENDPFFSNTRRDPHGNIHLSVFDLCLSVVSRIPIRDTFLDKLLWINNIDIKESFPDGYDKYFDKYINQRISKFIDRKHMINDDIKTLDVLKENINFPIGDYYTGRIGGDYKAFQLNTYIIQYVERMLDIDF